MRLPITGIHRHMEVLIDDEDFERCKEFTWWISYMPKDNYYRPYTKVLGKTTALSRFLLNAKGKIIVDHKDRNPLNNQKNNLRLCSQNQNLANSCKKSYNTSGFKGVYWHKKLSAWHSQIRVNGKRHNLGLFANKEDAANAYNQASLKYFGEFAYLNKVWAELTRKI